MNYARIIDGVRLCKAWRYRYEQDNMDDLENKIKGKQSFRNHIIVTDGSFSMDGTIAQLDQICDLADTYNAVAVVGVRHSTGFLVKTGRGTYQYRHVMGRVEILNITAGGHPIVPIMLYETVLAQTFAARLLEVNYIIGFLFP